ncbi:hypothetical protein [Thermomonas carbonis]|uniref:Uncharacterized protein n=1 Tax=Thermomonas carbonis TaxID=1463158 RepID=A0A7G9SNJ6_9GAMM|nr:hypothetical protein [Thermomonas carbonis]QNN69421.1 hypothetical protein H9L16_12150 [Thermomonas carbonis]
MLEWVVERLIGLLGPIAQLQKDKRELADNALRAVSQALNETFLYYRDFEASQAIDPQREAQLVRLWSAAAIPLRHIDAELAGVCEHKAEYWVNPRSWDHQKIEQFGIGLENVRERYRSMLAP